MSTLLWKRELCYLYIYIKNVAEVYSKNYKTIWILKRILTLLFYMWTFYSVIRFALSNSTEIAVLIFFIHFVLFVLLY